MIAIPASPPPPCSPRSPAQHVRRACTCAATAYVSFYEGGNGTQAIVCSIPVPSSGAMSVRQIDFTNDPFSCENDEARSMGFIYSSPGLTVEVWDRSSCANPLGQSRSDYSRTTLAVAASPRIVVGTFEATSASVRGLPYYESLLPRQRRPRRQGLLRTHLAAVLVTFRAPWLPQSWRSAP